MELSCPLFNLYPLKLSKSNLYFFQIVFIDDASRVGDLAKKFGFQEKDVITLKHGRSHMFLFVKNIKKYCININ